MGPCIIVFPDCFTCLGGNQYVNSSGDRPLCRLPDARDRPVRRPRVPHARVARAPRLLRQVVGRLRRHHPRHAVRARHWGAIGRSLGRRLLRVLLPPRLAAHAERARPLPPAAAASRPAAASREPQRARADGRDDGRVARFLEAMWDKEKLNDAEAHALMELAMAATYDPDPQRAARLSPAGRPRHRRAHPDALGALARARPDPSRRHATRANLRTLRGIYIDCGWRDQYHLHFGARILSRRARGARHRAHVRGVRRHALVDRLPHGREPAVSLSRAQAVRGTRDAHYLLAVCRRDSRCCALALACADADVTAPPVSNRRLRPRLRRDQGEGLGQGGACTSSSVVPGRAHQCRCAEPARLRLPQPEEVRPRVQALQRGAAARSRSTRARTSTSARRTSSTGNKAKAQEHLAALERICGKGCEEYQDLARAIAQAK